MGRNSIVDDANPVWWHLGKLVQTENTRFWETQDRIGKVQYGDSSEESRTWLSQIEDDGKKKYRAESTIKNFEPETEIKKQTRWSRIRGQNSVNKELWENCWQWKANGQYSKGDNCSFRHDINKRAEPPQPNPYTESSTRQSVRNASRTRSPRGRSPSGKMARLPCNDYLKGPSATPFLWKMAPSRMLVLSSPRTGMQIWGRVLLCTSPGWRTA